MRIDLRTLRNIAFLVFAAAAMLTQTKPVGASCYATTYLNGGCNDDCSSACIAQCAGSHGDVGSTSCGQVDASHCDGYPDCYAHVCECTNLLQED